MNKTAIEWCDYTWNPVTGCKHGCPYCYARKIAERFRGSKAWPQGFEPMFHPGRLKDPRKLGTKWNCPEAFAKGSTIFVCSMADLFGEWVPARWIWDTLEAMDTAKRHTYIMLTKNPRRIASFAPSPGDQPRGVQNNWWFGASVTCREDTRRIDNLQNRMAGSNRFISFEPLLGDPGPLDFTGIKQVIIGAQTNPDQYVGIEWVMKICEAADKAGAKVFMKDSLAGRWPDRELRRELAWPLNKSTAVS
jgi:protein gp37